MTVYGERTEYHQICDMLQERRGKEKSFTDLENQMVIGFKSVDAKT